MDSSSFEHVVSVRGAVFAAVACATAPERTPLTPNRSGLVPRSLTGTHETSWPLPVKDRPHQAGGVLLKMRFSRPRLRTESDWTFKSGQGVGRGEAASAYQIAEPMGFERIQFVEWRTTLFFQKTLRGHLWDIRRWLSRYRTTCQCN